MEREVKHRETTNPKWRAPPKIGMKFEAATGMYTEPTRPSHFNLIGFSSFVLFLLTFLIYYGLRIAKTMNTHQDWFVYQLFFLLVELLPFFCGIIFGMGLVRVMGHLFTLFVHLHPQEYLKSHATFFTCRW